jgi:hypothetical protein
MNTEFWVSPDQIRQRTREFWTVRFAQRPITYPPAIEKMYNFLKATHGNNSDMHEMMSIVMGVNFKAMCEARRNTGISHKAGCVSIPIHVDAQPTRDPDIIIGAMYMAIGESHDFMCGYRGCDAGQIRYSNSTSGNLTLWRGPTPEELEAYIAGYIEVCRRGAPEHNSNRQHWPAWVRELDTRPPQLAICTPITLNPDFEEG